MIDFCGGRDARKIYLRVLCHQARARRPARASAIRSTGATGRSTIKSHTAGAGVGRHQTECWLPDFPVQNVGGGKINMRSWGASARGQGQGRTASSPSGTNQSDGGEATRAFWSQNSTDRALKKKSVDRTVVVVDPAHDGVPEAGAPSAHAFKHGRCGCRRRE